MDEKYDLMRHPNIKYTADGGQPPYEHGTVTKAAAKIEILEVYENEQKSETIETDGV